MSNRPRSPLSGYEKRYKGDKGEPGLKGDKGDDGVNGPANVIINNQTDDYTLVLADANVALVEMDKATANNLTIPPDSSVAFPIGAQVLMVQAGVGQTTLTPGSGVTILSAGGNLKTTSQYSGATLIKKAANTWYAFGDLTT